MLRASCVVIRWSRHLGRLNAASARLERFGEVNYDEISAAHMYLLVIISNIAGYESPWELAAALSDQRQEARDKLVSPRSRSRRGCVKEQL